MRKLTAFVLIFMLMLSTVAVGYAAPKGGFTPPGQAKKMVIFEDVADDYWAASTIYELAGSGMLKGYGNGKFMPNKPVTKLESLVMIYEAANGEGKDSETGDYGLYKGPDWGKGYYAWAGRNGVFGDSAKLFNANAAITRAEFAFYAANLNVNDDQFDWDSFGNNESRFDDEEELGVYKEQIRWMNRNGLMIGDDENMFHGGGALKRAEAAMVMHRLTFFDYGEVSDPYATIYVEKEAGCITSLDPEIEIRFSEFVFDDDDENGEEFNESNADVVIFFEDANDDSVVFTVTDIERTATKGIWTIEPDEDLKLDEEYTIWLDYENIFDEAGNELKGDAEEIFWTCESYDMTASYDVDETFSDDWIGFTINVDGNDDKENHVKIVFNFEDIPEWLEIQYDDGGWKEMTKDGDTCIYPEFTLEDEDETIGFRAYISTPGAYVIPVEFIDTEADPGEEVLFTIDMEMGRVTLADGSRGVAGNGVIYELSSGTAYRVTEIDDGDKTVYYTNSEGELEEGFEDMEALDDVEMIIGLDNSLEYLVEVETE
ncbi:MAG: S-layer homology domain-containing protein [Peptostreptococcaceae bacterium]|nr:S-layer homology domain-containing protein [Peptostreptococcaceae bacterium]